ASVIHRPKLLILDEPFSGLDPINVDMIIQAILQLKNEGMSIVFSSHQMNRVEELCEDLCILRKGSAVVQGNLKEIKRSFGIQNVIIHAEDDTSALADIAGVTEYKKTTNG